jgi:hypothetical protein
MNYIFKWEIAFNMSVRVYIGNLNVVSNVQHVERVETRSTPATC